MMGMGTDQITLRVKDYDDTDVVWLERASHSSLARLFFFGDMTHAYVTWLSTPVLQGSRIVGSNEKHKLDLRARSVCSSFEVSTAQIKCLVKIAFIIARKEIM